MKKSGKFTPLAALCALVFAVALIIPVLFMGMGASASTEVGTSNEYRYELDTFNAEYDINSDCSISVTETLSINYLGIHSTGFIRDIPVNAGARVKNIKVEGVQLLDGTSNAPYSVRIDDSDFISVDIGDTRIKTGYSETYRLTYTYCISNGSVKSGLLPLNVIGGGFDSIIKNSHITVKLPEGFESCKMYYGAVGTTTESADFRQVEVDGRDILIVDKTNIPEHNALTFYLTFEEGAVRPYFDFTPYWFAIAGGILMVLMLLIKLIFFNRDRLVPVVNLDAPDKMDPLLMGKLIDNKVNAEDVTSLIFYWADKGYVKINLDDKDDPTIIKIRNLPATSGAHEQIVFAGLFAGRDAVKPSELKYRFYGTFERATATVNDEAKGLYRSSSIGISIIIAVLFGLLLGIAPLLLGMLEIHLSLAWFYSMIALVPALVLYGLAETVIYNRFKNRGKKNAIFFTLLFALICAITALYIVLVPSSLIPLAPKAVLAAVGLTGVTLAVTLISRTKDYNRKLGDIVGFRNFILLTEKDRLEKLLEDDPQLYYHILPYAQVLNVSDIWENKFKDIAIAPPAWATASSFDNAFDYIILNNMIRHSMSRITSGMIARPSSSGMNGGGHMGGFSGGGFAGGGFGGGGGRGR